ncbi:aberrant root formation protein 4 isoform X2 [Euphorbia lathyris]|uniref:aberrant root formation protein 4 isoform X2 n=1 Tax=Euphorbia lathyris TaxID=212925 RepID=UPI0033143D45
MSADSTDLREAPDAHPLLLRLKESLSSCAESIQVGDGSSLSELVNFLETISGSALADPDDENAQNTAFEVLSEIHRFAFSPALDQEVMDALSFELPKAVAKFAGLSRRCLDITDRVIDRFIETCSPRDMLSILCEALGSSDRPAYASGYVASLLSGLSKVLLSLQRRHLEQVKVALPVIVNVLKATCSELVAKGVSSETVDESEESMTLYCRALAIADSIQAVCAKMEGKVNEKLRALLSLYVLQIMALLSLKEGDNISSYLHLVSQLTKFFPYCGLSYLGLITGSDVDIMGNTVTQDEEDDFMSCLSYVKHGACLSVIWGHIYDDVAQAGKQNVSTVRDQLQNNQTNRWQAIGMLKHILASTNMLWEIKKHAINFLLWFTNGSIVQDDVQTDGSFHLPSLYTASEAITKIIIYAPSTELRKNAFEALKRVLADSPTPERFDIVKALITNSNSSSMIAILLDLVRGDLHKERCQRISVEKDGLQSENQENSIRSLWNPEVLEFVENVLRPPEGGPPCFPENGDAVLAALNLYRFILITESAGKTNYTAVLSKNNLQKAYNEWLMPLRTVVTRIMSESKNDCDQLAVETVCALNPVEFVLYRCIELVEEKLKHST